MYVWILPPWLKFLRDYMAIFSPVNRDENFISSIRNRDETAIRAEMLAWAEFFVI